MNNDDLEYDYYEDIPSPATLEKKKRRRRRIVMRVISWALVVVLVLLVIGVGVAIYMVNRGGKSLQQKTEGNAPTFVMDDAEPTAEPDEPQVQATATPQPIEWQPDWIQYGDTIYDYNENIMTFLFMGIDKAGEVELTDKKADGGQSDAMFLVVVNPETEKIDLIGINRDTMVDIICYGYEVDGEPMIIEAQLTTQHGFGDGGAKSAQYTMEAVSNLFYDLPITGYVSIGYDAIPKINDAIGGVDVVCLEDLTYYNKKWTEGAELHLEGREALMYVQQRDCSVFESARGRLARQKQYLGAFVSKIKAATKEDITTPVTLYQKVSEYMTTDVSADEVVYLTSQLIDYDFGQIYTLEGETIQGERFEEFYPDYGKLKELMLQVFYKPVELNQ